MSQNLTVAASWLAFWLVLVGTYALWRWVE